MKLLQLKNYAIIVEPLLDNVAIATKEIWAGASLRHEGLSITIAESVAPGERFALAAINEGMPVVQFGYAFGTSTGIQAGERISNLNTQTKLPPSHCSRKGKPGRLDPRPEYERMTFMGYRRSNGACGTRNFYLVVPTSMCASATAAEIAHHFQERSFRGVDGVVGLPHTEGCGCAGGLQIDRVLSVLRRFVAHPNVAGALLVDLGCEQTNAAAVRSFFEQSGLGHSEDLLIDWLTIQQQGGTAKSVNAGVSLVNDRLARFASTTRNVCPIGSLVIGAECGASDSFSGITANRVIGRAVDKVVYAGGAAIMSEIPEMRGAEPFLIPRMRNEEVVKRFRTIMRWYARMTGRLGYTMEDNLVPENRVGGLLNPYIKSLGAVMKGGTTPIEGILEYGEAIDRKGLHIMQGPGNDLESVTGLAASGVNLICFSTGRGTVTGSAIVPVIKISSTTDLFRRLPEDIDFDAGPLLEAEDQSRATEELGAALLERMIAVASGERSHSEINRQRQFQIWTAGKLSL